jgi:hypothetical protein
MISPDDPDTPDPAPSQNQIFTSMKITHLAIAGIMLLAVAACFLMMDSANDKKIAAIQDRQDKMMDLLKQYSKPPAGEVPAVPAPTVPAVASSQPPAPVAAVPPLTKSVPPSAALPPGGQQPVVPTISDLPDPSRSLSAAAQEKLLLDAEIAALKDKTAPPQYNAEQTRIKNLPAMAKIKNYNSELAFVELDAGRNRNLEKGTVFSIRRDAMLVGKVKVTDSIEDASSIADVDTKSVPPGIQIQPGDELVLYK